MPKQAKSLSDRQAGAVLTYLSVRPRPERNQVMFLLSVKAGLRAVEIAKIRWRMVLDPEGKLMDHIALEDAATKGKTGGRFIPLHPLLRDALQRLLDRCGHAHPDTPVVGMVRGAVVNWFFVLYRDLGMSGCSSHSGRRTFITKTARRISTVGGSLRDVQQMAGHKSLGMTQAYIEPSEDAKRKVVQLI